MILALAGGSGSSKLLDGLYRILGRSLSVISNVGDNYWYHGLYVCPDVDIATYALAEKLDWTKGWGLKGDTFNFMAQLKRLNFESWFKVGDRDLATSVIRTQLLKRGKNLTEITALLARRFGVKAAIYPASNEHAPTLIRTNEGTMHLQEFWVKKGGQPEVRDVIYHQEGAEPTRDAVDLIKYAHGVIVCPGNPVTSIGPILAFDEIRKALQASKQVVAVSPFIGQRAFSGPAAKLMNALGYESSVLGLADLYRDFVDILVVDPSDMELVKGIRSRGIKPVFEPILIKSKTDSLTLANRCLQLIR